MNIYKVIHKDVIQQVADLVGEGKIKLDETILDDLNFLVEPTKEKCHGDIALNIAMVLAKPLKMSPRQIGELLVSKLGSLAYIKKAEVAGPGFINLIINDYLWQENLRHINELGRLYGASKLGGGRTIHLEFVSANPTGPMHIGHARSGAIGDSLARLLKFAGYNIFTEFYINDAGGQIEVLCKSAYVRYKQALGLDKDASLDGLYPGEYLIEIGKRLADKYGDNLLELGDQAISQIRDYVVDSILNIIKGDLAILGVEFDSFRSEQRIRDRGKIDAAINKLKAKGLIYEGILEEPKGKEVEDWEAREQLLFKSEQFGDDLDRPVQKNDGSYTYFAGDLGYALDKIERGFSEQVVLLGADHGGYVKRMQAAVRSLGENSSLKVLLFQLVNLQKDGVPFKMSKRSGNFVTLREVAEMVGKDVIRFIMLTRRPEAVLDFDIDKVIEKSAENPVFYVQYAYARCSSVIRKAKEEQPEAYKHMAESRVELSLLSSENELELMKILALFPRYIEQAAINFEPHRIVNYLQKLAGQFHSLWNEGRGDESLRFIVETNPGLTSARLYMLRGVTIVIRSALKLLNVDPLEKM